MTDKDQIRKIQFTGKSSYIVSLPKDWIKDQGLKQGDQVTVGRNGSNTLEVKPVNFSKSSGDESSNLTISPEDEKSAIVRKLIALYFLNAKTLAQPRLFHSAICILKLCLEHVLMCHSAFA